MKHYTKTKRQLFLTAHKRAAMWLSITARLPYRQAFAESLRSTIDSIREEGHTTIQAITDELYRQGVPSARGGTWSTRTTHRLLRRLATA